MADLTRPDIVIIGCGNSNRNDDGAGPKVIALLRQRGVPGEVRLFDAGTDGMAVIYQARGASHLIIVDACKPSGAPGSIYEVPGDVLAAPPKPGQGLHDFRWDHALYSGHRIYGEAFPSQVSVFLIEAASLDLGFELTPEVDHAVGLVAGQIEARASGWLSA
ncbi:hydrogenase maturation protease [Phreatobacter oligotrophus]|jgi:hydrogenase maturation protease|uniref:hydrogenase maturation protease n=1 Tax=Phreatobacter oligotrophus TaxID=1122261 RepID=UPI000D339E68|nr:hydrogenase maturation protease [Phreatobacter oligotrophus]